MAVTREEALRQLIKILKEISVNIGRGGLAVIGRSSQSVNLSSVTTALNNVLAQLILMLTQLTSINSRLIHTDGTINATMLARIDSRVDGLEARADTTNINLSNIRTATEASQVDLAAIEALTITIDSVLDSMNSKLDTIDSIDYFLSGDTTDGGDLLNELQSIDANWNLLSVNNLALLSIESKLDDIENEVDAIEESMSRNTWDFRATYTCTANGTLIVSLTVPSDQRLRDWWVSVLIVGGSGPWNVLVSHENTNAPQGSMLDYIPTVSVATGNRVHTFDAQDASKPVPAGHKIVITILTSLTTTTPDVVTIAAGGEARNENDMTVAITGTGTFTESRDNDMIV